MTTVLVRPARAENLGAACRALKNMGLRQLTIVEPAPDASAPATRNAAYGAWDLLDGAAHLPTLREAVADAHLVVGTSGRSIPKRSVDVRHLGELVEDRARSGERTAVVFGSESSGLPDSELDLCQVVLRIPADADQPSLNLAQAVLLAGWEIRRVALEAETADDALRAEGVDGATAGDIEECLDDLAEALLIIGYLNPQNPKLILAEIRRMLARARPSQREVALVRGMARQIRWAGLARERRAGMP